MRATPATRAWAFVPCRHQSLRRYEPDQVPRQNLMLLAAGSPRCPAMDAVQKVASQFLGPEPPLVMCKQIARGVPVSSIYTNM